jgi:uncharacterized membrane protein
VKTRILFLIRHAMYNLRGGFLLRPLAIALSLGAFGAVLSWTEESFPELTSWTPKIIFPSHADPQVAQVILGGIAASTMTVVSIVFAILLMTLTLASMQFSPRIIVSFAKDWVTQWTLGIFLGTFCYCMAALPAARSVPQPFAPMVTVMGAMFLVVACVSWLLFFIHHISQAISVNHIVDRIAFETEAMIDEVMPRPRDLYRQRYTGLVDPSSWLPEVLSNVSGYIRFVDIPRLVFLAKDYRVQVHLLRRVGHFVPEGVPLLAVSKGDRLSRQGIAEFRGAFDIGPTRTLQQDVEYGVLQIVDIALKAISPAVNDPTTGVGCVDQLSRVLIRFASREPQEPYYFDPPGFVRVSVPWLSFERLLESAYAQIRLYAKSDMAVSLRLLRALGDIANTTDDPDILNVLVEEGRRVVGGCSKKLGEVEIKEMRLRLAGLERRVAPQADGTPTSPGNQEMSARHSRE